MAHVTHLKNRKWIRRILLLGISCLVFGTCLVWLVGGELCRSANREVGAPPDDFPLESVRFSSQSGATVHGWFVNQTNSDATILLVHPLRGDRKTMMSRANMLRDEGYSLLSIDLQAHGESIGPNITFGHLEKHDVAAAVRFAKKRNPDHRIGLIGWSLGGAAAILAASPEVDAMVLESVYPTIDQAVANRLKLRLGTVGTFFSPLLLGQLNPRLGISAADLRPVDAISQIGCPTLLLAGDSDVHTPVDETQELFQKAIEPKRLVLFKDAAHVDLFAFDRDLYEQEVQSFFAEHLLPKSEL